jgi:hypothetical protein
MTDRRLLTRPNPPRAAARPRTRQRTVATAPAGPEVIPDTGREVGSDSVPTTCKAVEAAVRGIEDARDRRMAEREAKLTTMETFGLIKRTRGGARLPNRKSEVFS